MLDITVDVRPERPEFADFIKSVDSFKGSNLPKYEVSVLWQ